MKPSKGDSSTNKARLQMLGVCLIDSAYAWHVPATVHLSEYGAFLIMMIQRGMGLEAVAANLEGYGIVGAHKMLSEALAAVPDGIDISPLFWDAIRVLTEGVGGS